MEIDTIEYPGKYFSSYDLSNRACPNCGKGVHYTPCRVLGDRGACWGWGTDDVGPMSCEGYIKHMNEKEPWVACERLSSA